MVHTYEVFVDIKEFDNLNGSPVSIESKRYEIDAGSKGLADGTALQQAKSDYPRATELDVRVTRLLH